MTTKRPTWHEYYMSIAELTSSRATCNRLAVGAVLVREASNGALHNLMTGYNGSLPGQKHCLEVGCLIHEGRCRRTIHAEMNVLDRCARYGIETENTIMYVTHYPCPDCMMHMINAGVRKVYYRHFYEHKFDNDLHTQIELVQIT